MKKEQPHSILYVDDEQQNLTSFRATFRRDYQIYLAKTGKEALEILRSHPVDLILSDQRMPHMTGVQLFEQIVQEFPNPIRMVVTGYSDMQAVIEAINKGKVYHYISKPWNAGELKLIMDNALEAYKMRKEIALLEEERNTLLLQTERQKKENLLSQFETLKNQVNPHFLFNSLNVLSMLVMEDGEKAQEFISKLTKVYRYVLDYREMNLIPLSEELNFLENYLYLQKIRFESGLEVTLQIPAESLSKMVPPLALQLLVENAIKHNIVSQNQPLEISITAQNNRLTISNNLQLRKKKPDSTGIGLDNLCRRYELLSEQKPEIQKSEKQYTVKLPLLES